MPLALEMKFICTKQVKKLSKHPENKERVTHFKKILQDLASIKAYQISLILIWIMNHKMPLTSYFACLWTLFTP
jgi:uncharacterized membrane protein